VGEYVRILKSLANLTHLEFDSLTFFPLTDIKLLLDSLPKKSLKSLWMMVEIDDEHCRRVNERMYSESLSNRQDEVDTAWNLESLKIVVPDPARVPTPEKPLSHGPGKKWRLRTFGHASGVVSIY